MYVTVHLMITLKLFLFLSRNILEFTISHWLKYLDIKLRFL